MTLWEDEHQNNVKKAPSLNPRPTKKTNSKKMIKNVFFFLWYPFTFPNDFMTQDLEWDWHTPLIFERPFPSMSQAYIDFRNGELTLLMDKEYVKFTSTKKHHLQMKKGETA